MDDKKLFDNLKKILGQKLKYGQLCKELELEPKKGNSKVAQFDKLAMYCKIEIVDNPRKYVVREVYDEEIEVLGELKKNKYQAMFEAAVCQAFLDNKCKPLYLSSMDTLKLFQEVNDNFSYACNAECMNTIGNGYDYMPEVGMAIYRILKQWTRRRLETMKNRKNIDIVDAYRLYKKVKGNGYEYIEKHDVTYDSKLHKICQEIYSTAIEEVMPANWGDVDKGGKTWVNDYKWNQFQNRVRELVKENIDGPYYDLRPIIRISCSTEDWLTKKIASLCGELNALTEINEESCRKAIKTNSSQLDNVTQGHRKEFIEINMKPNPSVSFRELLKKANEKKRLEEQERKRKEMEEAWGITE